MRALLAILALVATACGGDDCRPGETRCVNGEHQTCVLDSTTTSCDPPDSTGRTYCRTYQNGVWVIDGKCSV